MITFWNRMKTDLRHQYSKKYNLTQFILQTLSNCFVQYSNNKLVKSFIVCIIINPMKTALQQWEVVRIQSSQPNFN
jgi:hypothetical protein